VAQVYQRRKLEQRAGDSRPVRNRVEHHGKKCKKKHQAKVRSTRPEFFWGADAPGSRAGAGAGAGSAEPAGGRARARRKKNGGAARRCPVGRTALGGNPPLAGRTIGQRHDA